MWCPCVGFYQSHFADIIEPQSVFSQYLRWPMRCSLHLFWTHARALTQNQKLIFGGPNCLLNLVDVAVDLNYLFDLGVCYERGQFDSTPDTPLTWL